MLSVIKPRSPQTNTVARICVHDDIITCRFPETNDDFREIVHALGYHWEYPHWHREIGKHAGDPLDRAAELGARLLASGFCVEFDNDDAQQRCLDRSYEPECTRWIYIVASETSEYSGWFYLKWRYDDDLYHATRRLTGSKYCKPGTVVPPEHFAEVVDFAEVHGFQFTESALELVEQARASCESALVVDFSADDLPQAATNWTRPNLEPQEFGIDPSLLDNDGTL